jgi:2-polyprenyl-6-methoxyphenol hydroxylase-like FAD-dependent oxidoreductase
MKTRRKTDGSLRGRRFPAVGVALAIAASSPIAWAAGTGDKAPDATNYDVVVVGGGLSGYAAALSASQNGAKHVLVLEKREGGGTGRLQNLGMEKETIEVLRKLGVDPVNDPNFTPANERIVRLPTGQSVRLALDGESLGTAAAGGQGLRTEAMLLKHNPAAIVPIDGVVHALRSVAAKTPGIDIVEGAEVTKVRVLPTGEAELQTEPRDVYGKPLPGAQARSTFRGRYMYDASGSRGIGSLLGVKRTQSGPEYPMATAVFDDADRTHTGNALLTKFAADEDGPKKYRLLFVSAPGRTTMTADLPPDVDPDSKPQVDAFMRSLAKRSGYLAPTASIVGSALGYRAARTAAARVLVGPRGQERIMIGGDALATATPFGLGANVAIHMGDLFGQFVGRAEEAKNDGDRADARLWVKAEASRHVAFLHTQDRVIQTLSGAPQRNGIARAMRAAQDFHDSTRQMVSTLRPGVRLLGDRLLRRFAGRP